MAAAHLHQIAVVHHNPPLRIQPPNPSFEPTPQRRAQFYVMRLARDLDQHVTKRHRVALRFAVLSLPPIIATTPMRPLS